MIFFVSNMAINGGRYFENSENNKIKKLILFLNLMFTHTRLTHVFFFAMQRITL